MKNNKTTHLHSTPKQGKIPVFFSEKLDINDPVLVFDRLMEDINIEQYLNQSVYTEGRRGYNSVDLLKTVIFGFMDEGYISLRRLEENCKVNLRYMYLMDGATPSYRTFGYFINNEIKDNVDEIFLAINKELIDIDAIDLNHLYIDGSKFEANANKYSWVWKKSTEKNRYKLFEKISALFDEINTYLQFQDFKITTNIEYDPEQLDEILGSLRYVFNINEKNFVSGRGHRKSFEQKSFEMLKKYTEKLKEYVEKIDICGPDRNSFSKTDPSATFMRMKEDYMGNDQLLPAYNVQIGVADEYIAVIDVNQYRSDMDCFIPLMEKFKSLYSFYPKYPVADAGYGSFNNYIFCEENGIGKYMKFPTYKKETKDIKYHDNPFRAVNFKLDKEKNLVCPNGKKFIFKYRKTVRGNKYGRQEEIYECENCTGCPYAEQCKKTPKNRTIRINEELTQYHQEVIDNLESTQGALLRMNRSIQAEGTFGIIKHDRWYKRIVRRGMTSVRLELTLIAIGHNLYKYYNKNYRNSISQEAA